MHMYMYKHDIYMQIDHSHYTVFMLIESMIQLPQENSIPGIFCILLERKRLSVIIFYESN